MSEEDKNREEEELTQKPLFEDQRFEKVESHLISSGSITVGQLKADEVFDSDYTAPDIQSEVAALTATQVQHPWKAVVRTVFQATVGFAAMWALIVGAMGIDETLPWVAVSLAVTGAITKVMALPQVNEWLTKYIPFLSAQGKE